MGEIELIFDTSALRGISLERLRAFSANKVRMVASPFCAFEGIRHLDDEKDFGKYRALMKKIDEVGVAHVPTYESSDELGLVNFNRRKKDDKAFAAAIAKYSARFDSIDEVETTELINTGDGRRILLGELVAKMRERIEEIHKEHMDCFHKYKALAVGVMDANGKQTFDAESLVMATGQIWLSFHKNEEIRTCELEGFMRYYPHLGGLFYRYFNDRTSAEMGGVAPTMKDGVDYRVTLHLGMNSSRILVSKDDGMHITPLRGIVPAYNAFMQKLTKGNLFMRDIPLVLSLEDLSRLELSQPLA